MKIFFLVLGIIVAVFALCFLIFLLLIKPNAKKRSVMRKYNGAKFAHRGLHGGTRAENSMSAFAAAVEAGYGIELDVRLSKDGEVVVFHDDTLDRVTGVCGRVDSKTAAELKEIKLSGTDDGIPTFREVLELVDGRVPLLVEIKEDVFKYGVTKAAAKILAEYKGEYIVESFNPLALAKLRELMPDVARGLLCDNYLKNPKYRKPMYVIVQNMMLNFRCKPDFIAYNHSEWRNPTLTIIRRLFGKTPLFCWTLKNRMQEEQARKHGFTGFIFEGYLSDK